MGPEKLKVSNLRYAISGHEILGGVDATVYPGEVYCVVGPSGAGKSTLLRAINRLVEPTSGEVFLDGEPTKDLDPLELRRRVGMVSQLPTLSGGTVAEAVSYGPRLLGRETNVEGLLESVGLDPKLAGRGPENLSVGQQQRVSVARALALEPEVLLMDEPTSALDRASRRQVEELVLDLNEESDLTFMVVSHALDQVERIAGRVLLLSAGCSEGEWEKEEFFSGGAGERARRFVAGEP